MLPPVRPQVRRSGCLIGFWKVGMIIVVSVGLMMAAEAIFEPWAFYLGGRFHITPIGRAGASCMRKAGITCCWSAFSPTRWRKESPLGRPFLVSPISVPRAERGFHFI
jgi:hypothetical protein